MTSSSYRIWFVEQSTRSWNFWYRHILLFPVVLLVFVTQPHIMWRLQNEIYVRLPLMFLVKRKNFCEQISHLLSHPVPHINIEVKSIFQLAIFTLKTPLFRREKISFLWSKNVERGIIILIVHGNPMVLYKTWLCCTLICSGLNYSIGHIWLLTFLYDVDYCIH